MKSLGYRGAAVRDRDAWRPSRGVVRVRDVLGDPVGADPWILPVGVVQAIVRKSEIRRLMDDDSPRSLARAWLLGAASSSCSYASMALARSLFRKGANFMAATAFQVASTNLVVELGIIMVIVLGWQFAVGEFVGGPLMLVIFAICSAASLRRDWARRRARRPTAALRGSMEGHAKMDMSVQAQGGLVQRLHSPAGFTATAQYFVMDLGGRRTRYLPRAVDRGRARRVSAGLVLALGVPPAPGDARHHLGATDPAAGRDRSFACSIGNVPLAAILWNGGMSFGGVLAFIFADLIILPILDIYRRYYGRPNGAVHPRHVLRRDGGGRADRRSDLQTALPRAHRSRREGRRGQRQPRLHVRAERRVRHARRRARVAIRAKPPGCRCCAR
jgi:uncharacterized membrane protein YraQ (UPF0718 family)